VWRAYATPDSAVTYLWPPCVADTDIIFYLCGFFFRLAVYHASTHNVAFDVALVRSHHVWNSANLERRSEMCCTRLTEKIQDTKITQKWQSAHHCTSLSGYILATKSYIDNRKRLVKQQYLLKCPHNMVNFGPLMAEIRWRVWDTQQISTGFASWLRY